MRRIRKIIEVGNSLGITIDKDDIEKLKIKKGDKLEVDFLEKIAD